MIGVRWSGRASRTSPASANHGDGLLGSDTPRAKRIKKRKAAQAETSVIPHLGADLSLASREGSVRLSLSWDGVVHPVLSSL